MTFQTNQDRPVTWVNGVTDSLAYDFKGDTLAECMAMGNYETFRGRPDVNLWKGLAEREFTGCEGQAYQRIARYG
jgi:hypothetical protein